MKLWEAMLKGAQNGPQLFGCLMSCDGGSCAIGAVMRGLGVNPFRSLQDIPYDQVKALYPELKEAIPCPACGAMNLVERNLWGTIVHLNNDHRWSRQRIAEWLANRELKFKPIQKQEVAV